MSWIKLRNDLRTHPKVVTLMSRMGVTMSHTIGLLSHCWMMADEHCDENGRIKGSKQVIDVLVEMPGFGDALESVGWLITGESDSGPWMQFVNYQEHNGSTSKSRAQAQKRKQEERSRKCHGDVTQVRDSIVTRGEESREEKNIRAPIAGAMGVESGDSPIPYCPIASIVGYWNEVLGQRVRDTNKRKTAIRARWRDEHFRANWAAAIRKVSQSAFCMGQNDRDWVATLDWFLRPDTVTKIMEGTYDDRVSDRRFRGSADNASKAQQRDQRLAQAISEFVAEDEPDRICRDGGDTLRIETARGIDEASDAGLVQTTLAVRNENDPGGDLEADLPF